MPIHPTIRLHLVRWSRRDFLNSGNPLRVAQSSITVTTDASRLGWGGHCLGNAAFGDWPRADTLSHINVLEFLAVLLSLRSFLLLLRRRTVLIRTDNVTVAAYINKQGGTHFTRLNALAALLWKWCRLEGIFPIASYIPGQDNLIADFLSPGSSSALGVDPPPDGHGPDNTDSRTTASGPIRVGTQCPPPQVLLQGSRPSSLEDRRILLPVEGVPGLCLPADLPHFAHTTEDSGGSSAGGADSTLVAEEELVPRTGRPTSRSPEDPAPALRPNSTADISDAAPSAERVAPDCVALIRRAGTQAGLSDRAAALIASSRRVSTCETYNSRLAGYFHWCESHGVEPRSAPAHHIADFLITLFDKGRLISTIKGHRSAIAAIHSGFADGTCVSTARA